MENFNPQDGLVSIKLKSKSMTKVLEEFPPSYEVLCAKIKDKFGFMARIWYLDDDEDKIDVADDEDLRMAIKFAYKKGKITFNLNDKIPA